MKSAPKVIYNTAIVLMSYSVFCITIGQLIPVYFKDPGIRLPYYLVLFIMLVITTPIIIFKMSYDKENKNLFSSLLVSLFFWGADFCFFWHLDNSLTF
jgi:RsiW-degrading membrane proteinase PrsW (M82 family)